MKKFFCFLIIFVFSPEETYISRHNREVDFNKKGNCLIQFDSFIRDRSTSEGRINERSISTTLNGETDSCLYQVDESENSNLSNLEIGPVEHSLVGSLELSIFEGNTENISSNFVSEHSSIDSLQGSWSDLEGRTENAFSDDESEVVSFFEVDRKISESDSEKSIQQNILELPFIPQNSFVNIEHQKAPVTSVREASA